MRIIRRARVPFIAAIIGAAVGGVALASIPGSDGTISGCYSKLTGALRVIDASKQKCPSYQVPISWSQTGPAGPPGPGVIASGETFSTEGSTSCQIYPDVVTYCNPADPSST